MLLRRVRLTGVAAALLAAAATASAQEPWEQKPFESDPKDLLAAAKEVQSEPGTSVVILLSETRWTFQADGRSECRIRTTYRVLTEDGVSGNGTVSAEWSPWYQERPVLRARVTGTDGQAHLLNAETLAEKHLPSNTPDVFTDRKSLTGPLPSLAIGAVVELETVTRNLKPFFEKGVVEYTHFSSSVPVQRQRLIIDAPEALPIKTLVRLMPDMKPKVETQAGRTVTTYQAGPLKPHEGGEGFAPSDVPAGPQVVFTTGSSWKDIAARYHEIVEKQIAEAGVDALGELPGKDVPVRERITRIVSKIQARVRYASLAFGDASIVPRPPAETLKRGYGDCKDKSTLVVAALRKAGIEAHVAVLLTGPGPDIEPELPGFGSFDHAIVRVASDPPVWIDPTDKFAKPGSLPIQDLDRLALVAAPTTETLTRTPAPVSGDNVEMKIREVRLADFGPATITETLKPAGAPERNLRYMVDQDRKAIDKALESYASAVFMAKKVVKSSYSDANDLTKPFELTLEMSGMGRGQTDLREAVVAVPLENLLGELPWVLRGGEIAEEPGKPWRKNDIVLSQPYVVEWQYHIVPPPGFEARPFPNADKTPLGPCTLLRDYKRNGDGSVTARFRFDVVRRRFTPDEAKEVRAGVEQIRQEGMLLIGFAMTGTAHLEAGRIREALAEYRKLAKDFPEKALYGSLISRALLSGGLGDAARSEARKAIALEPSSVVAHETLGWVLEQDLIGRRFQKGWDPKGAEEAYRAVIKLKTENNLEDKLELAILLEHDAEGQRYTPGSKLKDAIALYKSVEKEIEGTNFENNLNYALLWSGGFGELRTRLRKPSTPTGHMMLAIAKAALEGADSALGYVTRTVVDKATRQTVLSQAAEHLLQLRYYAEAAALLTAGARGAPDAANLLSRADRIGKTKRWGDTPPEGEDPGSLVKRLMYYTMTREADIPAMKTLMSRYVPPVQEGPPDEIYTQMRHGVQEVFRRQGMSVEVGRDLTMSLLEPEVEGDDASGFRVRIPPTFGTGRTQLWYLNKEDGKLRMMAPGDGSLGRLALDLIKDGKADVARKWLAWAADELPDGAYQETVNADPFAVAWKTAKDGDEKALRTAAAALAAEGPRCEAAIEVLEQARKDAADAKKAYPIDHALVLAYNNLNKDEESVAAAKRMAGTEPDAEIAQYYVERALRKMKKWDEVQALLEAQLKKKPGNAAVLRSLQHLAMSRGRYAESQEYGRKIVKLGSPEPGVYNNIVWAALLEGKVSEASLRDAQKAVMNSQGRNDAFLHTMATLYADLGKPVEARDVLLQTFQSRPNTEPEDHDWYVLGRIAEEYGALDAAVAAYKRTAAAANANEPNSTNQLSLRRLKLLEEKK